VGIKQAVNKGNPVTPHADFGSLHWFVGSGGGLWCQISKVKVSKEPLMIRELSNSNPIFSGSLIF
jgi:hypothetical protein